MVIHKLGEPEYKNVFSFKAHVTAKKFFKGLFLVNDRKRCAENSIVSLLVKVLT